MPAENQLEAYPEHTSIHTYIHSYLVHHIQSSYIKTVPYTFNIGYRALTSELQQTGVTELGNRLQRYYYGYTEARKNLQKKTLLGKKYDRKSG